MGDLRRGNPRVFKGKRARQMRAAMKRLQSERERKGSPTSDCPAVEPPLSDPEQGA